MKLLTYLTIVAAYTCATTARASTQNLQMLNTISESEGEAFGYDNTKQILNSLVEYPLSSKQSIGGTVQASHTDSDYNGSTKAYALNSAEIFHRYKFYAKDKLGITIHNSYKFPGIYSLNENLGLMPRQADYELRFLFAFNMKDRLINTVVRGDTPYFSRVEVAYRKRFSNPFNEVRFTFWGGYNLNSKFALLLQDNITWNVESKSTATNSSYSNIAASKNANNIAMLSLMYRFDTDKAVQFGYFRRLSGNNPFYDYQGVTVGLWNSF